MKILKFPDSKLESLKKIGQGATSDIYLFEPDRIIKLFHESYSFDSVQYEAHIALHINDSKIKAPFFYKIIKIGTRFGLLYEFIDGELLLHDLIKKPLRSKKIIKKMVDSLININSHRNMNLPKQKDRFFYLLSTIDLLPEYKDKILKFLSSHESHNDVCHGDFHAGNIIKKNSELYTIDWMNCYSGNKKGDVLRSYLMIISPFIPFDLGFLKKRIFLLYKKYLGHVFLLNYLRKTNTKKRSLFRWWPVIAAVRLADNVPNENDWLMKKIIRFNKYL